MISSKQTHIPIKALSVATNPTAVARAKSTGPQVIRNMDTLCTVLSKSFSQESQEYKVSNDLLTAMKKSIPQLKSLDSSQSSISNQLVMN